MKTTLEAEDLIFSYVDTSSLKTEIATRGGEVFKGLRPINDRKEAVEVVALVVDNEQLQDGIVNVNVFVPNLVINVNNVQDDTQPDHARLKQLAIIGKGIFNDNFFASGDYGFELQQQSVIRDEVSKQHYINFRIRFYSINLN